MIDVAGLLVFFFLRKFGCKVMHCDREAYSDTQINVRKLWSLRLLFEAHLKMHLMSHNLSSSLDGCLEDRCLYIILVFYSNLLFYSRFFIKEVMLLLNKHRLFLGTSSGVHFDFLARYPFSVVATG